MTPAPTLGTDRLKIHYTGPLGSHVMLFHKGFGTSAEDFKGAVAEIITSMAVLTFDGTSFHTAEFSEEGSNLFFPTSWTPIDSPSAVVPTAADGSGKFLQFGGRGTDGRRVKWYLFETHASLLEDMRYAQSESDAVDDVVAILVETSGIVGTITGTTYLTYSYANINFNDHIVKKAR